MEQLSNFKMFDDQDDSLPMPTNIAVHVTDNNSIYVTSREIATQFGREHKNVLAAIERIVDKDKSSVTKKIFFKTSYTDSKNRNQPEYYVNQAGFNMLASGSLLSDIQKRLEFSVAFQLRNEEIRSKLNKIMKENTELKNMPRELKISQGLIAANEVITEQKQVIAQQQKVIEQKDKQLQAAQPDIDYANAIKTSTNNILVRQLAGLITTALRKEGIKEKVGEKKLFIWLRQNGYLIRSPKNRDYNMPTKRSLDMGIMEGKLTPIEHKTMPGTWNSGTPEITQKGAEYFTLKILKIYREGGTIDVQ